jgi:hypothetical protein
VADDGVGDVLAALAAKPEAEGNVDVFVIAEVSLVKAAGFDEQLTWV